MERLYHISLITIFCAAILWCCSDPFAYSPFEAKVDPDYQNTTAKQLQLLAERDTLRKTSFKIALISDSHYHFNDLAEAVEDINKKGGYEFIIVAGDFTENGLLKEYELFHSIMSKADIPYLTVIGNHDHLSNGGAIYEQMFGARNYTFSFNNVRFVVWDNNIWESEKEADYDWLKNALRNAIESDTGVETSDSISHVVALSHIPPFDGQLIEKRDQFHEILRDNQVKLSIHGHKHEYFAGELSGDGITYMTVGSPQKGSYAELIVEGEKLEVRKVDF